MLSVSDKYDSVNERAQVISESMKLHILWVWQNAHDDSTTDTVITTGAALLENNEASAKLTTANGGTFTSSSARLSSQSRYSTLDR